MEYKKWSSCTDVVSIQDSESAFKGTDKFYLRAYDTWEAANNMNNLYCFDNIDTRDIQEVYAYTLRNEIILRPKVNVKENKMSITILDFLNGTEKVFQSNKDYCRRYNAFMRFIHEVLNMDQLKKDFLYKPITLELISEIEKDIDLRLKCLQSSFSISVKELFILIVTINDRKMIINYIENLKDDYMKSKVIRLAIDILGLKDDIVEDTIKSILTNVNNKEEEIK